jgi:cell division septum initiation protein DivIVA
MRSLTTTRSLISPAAIREASLPKSLRGFDEAATRQFLIDVAETVQTLMDDRDKLQRSLEKTKEQARIDPEDPAAIGNVLLAAQRAGEELVAHAHATATQITAGAEEASERLLEETRHTTADAERELDKRREASEDEHARLQDEIQNARAEIEAERQRIVTEARAEAEELAAQSRERLDALVLEERTMTEFVADRRKEFVDMLQSALDVVHDPQEPVDETEPELATVLKSRASHAGPSSSS